MRTRLPQLALVTLVSASSLLVGTAPAQAAGPPRAAGGQVDGPASFDEERCPAPPAGYGGFTDYPGLLMHGDLEGCLYTDVQETRGTPTDGVYVEMGEEVFVGTLNGGRMGTFTTTYRFQGKYAAGVEVFGRCQHPIVDGSGTGGFAGATGRLDFKDFIDDAGVTYEYRGHIRFR